MCKKCLLLFLSVIVVLHLSFYVFAHSGGTDANGGHHDGDDYHYHHGHSAHDHWDMDGDGDLDCPYDFDDKTGESGGGSSNLTGNKKPPKTDQDNGPSSLDKIKNDACQYLAAGIGILFVSSMIASCFSKRIAELFVFLALCAFSLGMILFAIFSILSWFL